MNQKRIKLKKLDQISLAGIALSLLLILQPYWKHGFKTGFFLIMFFTLSQLLIRHFMPKKD